MKQINYTGPSKLISRIVHLLNRKAPLPLNGDGDPVWGTNGQVLTTDGSGNTSWTSGGGSGGHIIQDNGTDMTSRAKLDFVGATVTDDAVNDATVVEFSQAQADWNEADNTKADYIKNKPTIPAAQIQSDWTQSDNTQADYIKNKPTIPTVNDGTLTIQQNGTTVGTFSANQSGNTTVNLTGGGSTYTAGDGINISAQNAISVDTAFTEASTRANIASGDSLSTIWGKIKKFFSDLKTVAFSGSYNDLSNKPTIPTDFVSKANGGRFGGNIVVDRNDGTSSAEGVSQLWLGNGAAIGSDGNSHGEIIFYRGQYFNVLLSELLTGNHYIFLPNKGGTIALTSDITDVTSYTFTPSENAQILESSINKVGRIVDCHLVLKILSSTSESSIQLGTIPTGARPLANQSQVVIIGNGILATITIGTNGVVYYFANTSALNWTLRVQFTYISAT